MADLLAQLKRVIEIIDGMVDVGIIDGYALGGATAANFYVDPFNTKDLDFFVHFTGDISSLDPLRPIIDHLTPMGYKLDGVEFDIEGRLVQFLPIPDELTERAVDHADIRDLGGFEVPVISAEYLVAIMLKKPRPQDLVRAKMFRDQEAVDIDALRILIERYSLEEQWQRVMQL